MSSLQKDIEDLLNSHSQENISNTPDFILASYLTRCLEAFEACVLAREDWYGHRHEPGGTTTPGQGTQENL